MRRSQRVLLALGLGIALAGGGIALADTVGSSSTAAPAGASSPPSTAGGQATIGVTTATVDGTPEQILVDAHGLPLYTYNLDTPTTSHVRGTLARLWPPLVSASPSEQGATGKLSVVADANGQQVEYNGHFLYTFVNDTPGQVTGQGVQGFYVATSGLGASTGAADAIPIVLQPNRSGY